MKKIMLLTAFSLGMVSAFTLPQQASASPEVFGKMEGKFRGKGLVKVSAKGKKESIRCKMNNKPVDGGKKLDIRGSCAAGGFLFSLNGYMEQTGGRNYRASMFRSLASIKQKSFGGKRSGNKINFSFNARDRLSKTDIKASINVNVKSASAYTVQISRSDPKTGKTFSVGTLSFAKR